MGELTEFQQAVLDRLDTATALGIVAASVLVMLVAMIAVRALWSR